MTSLPSKFLILTLLISSIGFASPPTPQVSMTSLMHHLGIKGFRSNIIVDDSFRSIQVEILKVENGEIVDTFTTSALSKIQMLNSETMEHEVANIEVPSTVDVIYEQLNRSKYKISVVLSHSNLSVPMDFTLDWKGIDLSIYPSELIVNYDPILFTGEIYEDEVSYLLKNNLLSQTDLNTNPKAFDDALALLEEQGIEIPTRDDITNIKNGLMIRVIGWPTY